MRTVEIAGQLYAVGLWWQIRSGGPAPRKVMLNLARERAKEFEQEGYGIVALRTQQYGLGAVELSKTKTFALAAAMRMPEGSDTFLGVFQLRNIQNEPFWWVCGIAKGIIAADGDAIFHSKEEALAAAHSLQQLFGVSHTRTCETPEESNAFLVPLLHAEAHLEPLFPTSSAKKKHQIQLAIFGAIVALLVTAYWLYTDYTNRETARQIEAARDAAGKYRKELAEHPERFFPMEWQSAPAVLLGGKQCASIMLAHPLVIMGWLQDEVICTPSKAINASWSHANGAAFVGLPHDMKLVSAQKAVQSQPLKTLPPRAHLAHTNLISRETATAQLYQMTQDVGANLENLTWEAPDQVTKDDVPLVAPWQRGKFSLSALPASSVLDLEAFTALDIPGLVVTSVIYNHSNFTWKIQGVVYAATRTEKR